MSAINDRTQNSAAAAMPATWCWHYRTARSIIYRAVFRDPQPDENNPLSTPLNVGDLELSYVIVSACGDIDVSQVAVSKKYVGTDGLGARSMDGLQYYCFRKFQSTHVYTTDARTGCTGAVAKLDIY